MGSNPIALTIKIKKLTVLVTMAGSIQILKKFCENRTSGSMFRLTGRDLGLIPLVRVAPLAESIHQ
jgi:hypothetical protein